MGERHGSYPSFTTGGRVIGAFNSRNVPAHLEFPVSIVLSPLLHTRHIAMSGASFKIPLRKQESPRTPLYKNPAKALDGRGNGHRVAGPSAWE